MTIYNEKLKQVERYILDLRCEQSKSSYYHVYFLDAFRHTLVYVNYPKHEYVYPTCKGCLYLPFIKDGVDIKITSCVYEG